MINDKKIKNIIVSTHDSLGPIRGGGGLRTLKCAEEFKRRGYNVTIIAPTEEIGELSGIKVHWLHAPKKQYSQILSTVKFNTRLLRKFLQFMSRTDLFFIHNTIAAVFMPFLKKIFRFTFVLDITDIHAEYLPIGERNVYERMLTPLLLKYEYFIINSADKIITVTGAMRDLLVSKGIDVAKITVIYDGVDTESMSTQKIEGSELGIIHLGIIDRQHGVEIMIQAAPDVIEAFPRAKFYFIGDGRELPRIKKIAENLKITDNCVFSGCLPCEEARNFLNKACIGIIPRLDLLANRIVTTLKLYEYWASGTAVISTRLQGVEEIARDGEHLLFFESGNVKELSEKIVILLRNKNARDGLIRNGLINAGNFQWGKIINQIVDYSLYDDNH